MAIRTKERQTSSRRRSSAVATRDARKRTTRAETRRPFRKHAVVEAKPSSSGINSYAKALRFVGALGTYLGGLVLCVAAFRLM